MKAIGKFLMKKITGSCLRKTTYNIYMINKNLIFIDWLHAQDHYESPAKISLHLLQQVLEKDRLFSGAWWGPVGHKGEIWTSQTLRSYSSQTGQSNKKIPRPDDL